MSVQPLGTQLKFEQGYQAMQILIGFFLWMGRREERCENRFRTTTAMTVKERI